MPVTYVEVFPANGLWNVRYCSPAAKRDIIALFGTHELPTPFSSSEPFTTVAASLRAIKGNASIAFVEAGR